MKAWLFLVGVTMVLKSGPALAVETQTPGLFKQVIPSPTGKNGYEEYVRAAEMIDEPLAGLALRWTPTQYGDLARGPSNPGSETPSELKLRIANLDAARELSTLDELGVRRLFLTRYGKALDLIRAGNSKPCFDPRTSFSASTRLPEFSKFRSLAQAFTRAAYAEYADGHPAQATQILLDILTFSRKIETSTLISSLSSIAMTSAVCTGFDEYLPWLSHIDAQKVIRYVDAALSEPPHYESVLRGELAFSASVLDTFNKSTTDPALSKSLVEEAPFTASWTAFTPTQRAECRNVFADLCRQRIQAQIDAFRRPESHWADPKADEVSEAPVQGPATPEQLARNLEAMISPRHDGWRTAIVRGRTQLRLLGLHARIVAYRWEHRSLPAHLADAVTEDQAYDPLSGGPFQYEQRGNGYRLYSKGINATGEVELRYQWKNFNDEEPKP